ncbi:hypothetical protein HOD29_00325 [archaeon]|jgi:hypothetical protein|nr:hypothetical protein [archaeon]
MGLFHKKTKEAEKVPTLPKLPELPRLPEFEEFDSPKFPTLDEPPRSKEISQLPSYPSTSFAEKFSQSTIKDAISGQEESDIEEKKFVEEKEFTPMTQIPLQKERDKPKEIKSSLSKEAEPIFIRIDKFEESLKIFEETKEQIKELGHMLHETKELKAKEDQELSSWETELQELKSRIGRVDNDLFSKIK